MNILGMLVIATIVVFGLIPLLMGILMVRSVHRNELRAEQANLKNQGTGTIDDIDIRTRRSHHLKNNNHKIAITILHAPSTCRLSRGNLIRFGRYSG